MKGRTQITGYVGSDPQVKTVGEQQVASFSVAVNRKTSRGEKQTLWVRVNAWGKLSAIARQYVKEGSLVHSIEGGTQVGAAFAFHGLAYDGYNGWVNTYDAIWHTSRANVSQAASV